MPPVDTELGAEILAAAPLGLALVLAPGTIEWANAAYFEATGRSPDLLGKDFHDLEEADGTWSEAIRAAVDSALAGGPPCRFEAVRARHRSRSGGVFLDVTVQPLPQQAGRPRGALLSIQDVSARVAETARAELFYASFRSSTNAMQLTDAKGLMIDVNPAYERAYGYRREECIGRRPNLVRSRYTAPEVYEEMWRDLTDPARGFWSGELLNRDRKGRERPVLLTITAVRDRNDEITHYLGVAVDTSERRDWELRVAHADKLASVGQLAAGVAHEINTPLANMTLVTESLRRKTSDPAVLARLDTLSGQIETAARIVRGLLDFSRREEPEVADLDLSEVVRSAVGFVRGKLPPQIALAEEYPAGPVRVAGDRHQLIQVITNLANNASDALETRGEIRVRVAGGRTQAEIEVLDDGPGFSPQVLPHLFEPFFTTKPEGKGTGLGLAVCHGIVQAHHGSITASNRPGGGAVFRITLPLARPPNPVSNSPSTPGE